MSMQLLGPMVVAMLLFVGAAGPCLAFGNGPHGPDYVQPDILPPYGGKDTPTEEGPNVASERVVVNGLLIAFCGALVAVWAIRSRRGIQPPGEPWR